MSFKIYNQKALYIAILAMGVLNVSLALMTRGNIAQIILGGSLILVGSLMIKNPVLVIDEKNIYIKNGFGMTVKTYPYTFETLRYESNRFWVGDKKLGVVGWMLDKKSLQGFLKYLEQNKK